MKIYLIVLVCLFSFPANGQIISTIAGNGIRANTGDGGIAATATLNYPSGLASDKQGNIYISLGYGGNGVRKINSTGIISRIVGTGASGYSGDGGLATNAKLNTVSQVALDTAGNIYVADAGNNVIRRIDATTNIISTVAGTGVDGYSGDGGPATSAQLNGVGSLCLDRFGNLYIGNLCRVRKVNTLGIISTVAGTGVAGYSGDNGLAATSKIYAALGITTDVSGNLYIADGYSGVRKVSLAGVITTVVGNGISGSSGDGGLATSAQAVPNRVKFDKFGNMYITEYPVGNKVRMVNRAGIITTIAGSGAIGFSGDGGLAIDAEMAHPSDITFDSCGNLYIGDLDNYRIRKITYPKCNYLDVPNVINVANVLVYPNPTIDALHIDALQATATYRLMDIAGRVWQVGALRAGDNEVSVRSLTSGIYLLELTDEQGYRTVRRIVKE